jgi:uncharacterized repeat protein (TIGR01451 family)
MLRRALSRPRAPRRSSSRPLALVIALLMLAALASPAAAQANLTLTTPFPGVSVQPGASASFTVTVSASQRTRADLSLTGAPSGWTAKLTGGGFEVRSVLVDPDNPPTVTLDISVPDDATEGDTTVTLTARGGGETATLPVTVHVASQAGGSVSLDADFPALQGTPDQSFDFTLQLHNDTPQQLTFSLQAQGPTGWTVNAHPTSETTAASVAVDAGSQEGITVTAKAPPDAATGDYPIAVAAVSGDHTAQAQLGVHITGRVEMQLTTPDQRLNTNANAGETQQFTVTIVNNGTSPLNGVALSGTGPSDWKIEFDPATVDQVAPNQAVNATANITPSANAIAGDYVVTLKGSTQDANESIDVRVTVETSPIWGIIGALLILLAIGGLVWVFRRYGRR